MGCISGTHTVTTVCVPEARKWHGQTGVRKNFQQYMSSASYYNRLSSVQPGGDAVLYFAGHGMQHEGKNYLLAANAKLTRKYELGEESLEAETVLDALSEK